MLALVCIIVILASNSDGASVLDLVLPLVSLVGSKHAIHIDGARCVRKVEAAISRIELRYRTGELVVRILISKLNELLHSLRRSGAVVIPTRLVTTTFAHAIETVDITGALAGSLQRGSIAAHIFGHRAIHNNLVAHFDIRVPGNPLAVSEIVSLVDVELAGSIFCIGNIEGSITERATVGKSLVYALTYGNLGNLAFHVVALLRNGIIGQLLRNSCDTGRVERILQGTRTLGFAGFSAATFCTALVYAVEAIEEGAVLLGLRGIALVVNHVTINDNYVAHLNLGVAGGELLVAQIEDTVSRELCTACGAIVGNLEGAIAVLRIELLIHGRNDTFYEHLFGAGDVCAQFVHVLDDTGHIERILQGTVTVVNLSFRTGLVDGEGGTGEADGEHDGGRTVVFRVLRNSNFNRLGLYGGLAVGCAEGDPIRDTANSPVTCGRDRYGLGATGGLKRERCLVQSQLGRAQVHFFVTADEHCCASYNCHKEVSEFHTVIFKIVINAYVLKYKYTTIFFLINRKSPGLGGSLGLEKNQD